MFKEFYASVGDLRRDLKPYLTFNVVVLVFSSILFIPFISYIINRLFLSTDTGVTMNVDIFKVVLSWQSILIFIGLSFLGVLLLFLLLGTQLIYSEMIIKKEEITMAESFLTTLVAIPKLLRFEVLYLILFAFLAIPLVEYEANPVIGYFLETPPPLLDALDMVPWARVAYTITLIIVLYLLLRMIFVFHGILLERKSIRASLKQSFKLTKGRSVAIFMKLFLLNSVLLGLLFGIYYGVAQVPDLLNIPVNYLIRQYMVTLAGLGLLLYIMILIPINLLFLTRRYHKLKDTKGLAPSSTLSLVQWKWLMRREEIVLKTKLSKKLNFALFLIISAVIAFSIGLAVNQDFLYKGRIVAIAAHRGDEKVAPENSMAAIKSAVENGADLVEIDLQLTKDSVVVLHHDSSLIRTVGISESISNMHYDEIKDLDAGSFFDESFKEERIPTLEDVFILMKEYETGNLLLDVKTNGDEEDLAREIINVIKAYNMEERVLIQSFNYTFLKLIREKNQDIKLGQIMYAAFGRLGDLDVDFYTVKTNMVSKSFVARARRADKGIFVWVIDKEEELKNMMTYDIDAVITSDLAMTVEILRTEFTLVDEEKDDEENHTNMSRRE